MNYRHSYHAGNFADVIKHIGLIAIILALQKKNTPFCYLDTHAGPGLYNLLSADAQKTKEYTNGIEKIIHHPDPPEIIKTYLHNVHHINSRFSGTKLSALEYYPGSPFIARELLRANDRMIACERRVDDYGILRNHFKNDKQVAIHHTDGYLGLKAFLPPQEKRGFILIDPPYEDPDEFTVIARSLPTALKRFESGVYAIWYPIKAKPQLDRFYRTLKAQISNEILAVELTLFPDLPNHLNGSGLVIINPPWQLDKTMTNLMPWVWNALTINKQGGFRVHYLK
jgi:23S rRNA (adenine2030-N6)-methyltransferase